MIIIIIIIKRQIFHDDNQKMIIKLFQIELAKALIELELVWKFKTIGFKSEAG